MNKIAIQMTNISKNMKNFIISSSNMKEKQQNFKEKVVIKSKC
jgi:hypothetical protein